MSLSDEIAKWRVARWCETEGLAKSLSDIERRVNATPPKKMRVYIDPDMPDPEPVSIQQTDTGYIAWYIGGIDLATCAVR